MLARERDIRLYDGCSGAEFETLVAWAFRSKGFRVEQVGGADDGGIDLLVWKGSRHAIVQCKAHAKPVGPAVLRDLLGALNHTAEAEIAFLATTNGVSSNALAWSADKPIVVLTPDHLVRGRLHL